MDAAIVSGLSRGLDGSSFVAVQLWVHDFKAFDALTAAEQGNAIGRRKSDNEGNRGCAAVSARQAYRSGKFRSRSVRATPFHAMDRRHAQRLNFVAFGNRSMPPRPN